MKQRNDKLKKNNASHNVEKGIIFLIYQEQKMSNNSKRKMDQVYKELFYRKGNTNGL